MQATPAGWKRREQVAKNTDGAGGDVIATKEGRVLQDRTWLLRRLICDISHELQLPEVHWFDIMESQSVEKQYVDEACPCWFLLTAQTNNLLYFT